MVGDGIGDSIGHSVVHNGWLVDDATVGHSTRDDIVDDVVVDVVARLVRHGIVTSTLVGLLAGVKICLGGI